MQELTLKEAKPLGRELKRPQSQLVKEGKSSQIQQDDGHQAGTSTEEPIVISSKQLIEAQVARMKLSRQE